jgi:poly(hydroxyalkanoate) depolymerase family esterase
MRRAALLLLLAGCLNSAAGSIDDGDDPGAASPDGGRGGAGGGPGGGSGNGDGGWNPGPGGDGGGSTGDTTCAKSTKTYGALKMLECVPSGMDGKTAQPAALVVAMHGYKQGIEQQGTAGWGFVSTSEWAKLAGKYKFYVIFPDKGTEAFSWYAFFGTSGIGRNDLEPKAIAQMVSDMKEKHNIDRVFVNGLSAGAFMAVVMLATYPDVFHAGSTFAGGAYGCSTQCAALGKKGKGWSWPGNHAPGLVTGAYPTVWKDAGAKKPRLLVFQGEADGAVTIENMADLVQQWSGAVGATAGATATVKGHEQKTFVKGSDVMVASILMKGIGHGTPVDPGSGPDQGGWDPEPSQTMKDDANAVQDWTNSAGIWGPYYSAKFFGLVP